MSVINCHKYFSYWIEERNTQKTEDLNFKTLMITPADIVTFSMQLHTVILKTTVYTVFSNPSYSDHTCSIQCQSVYCRVSTGNTHGYRQCAPCNTG